MSKGLICRTCGEEFDEWDEVEEHQKKEKHGMYKEKVGA